MSDIELKMSRDSKVVNDKKLGKGAVVSDDSVEHIEAVGDPIAIIGMSGFFPGSDSVDDFLKRLEDQESLFSRIPEDHFPEADVKGRYGAFLKNIAGFDHSIFNITATEAEFLDPRQRLLLMSTWWALEDACYLPEDLDSEKVDVYVASEGTPYSDVVSKVDISPYSSIGVNGWALPNRISHQFKFTGKSVYIDTACSGTCTALAEAMQSLRSHHSNYAVVGAANLLFGKTASHYYLGQEALGILMDEKTCFPFQNNANGFLPAEGVGTVILKRYSKAIEDGDNIHAVLLGAHVNHVGGHGSLTMPSAKSQAEAIVGAYRDAGINSSSVCYIEAHGVSSVLADTEEIKGIKLAQSMLDKIAEAPADLPCKISTSKPNVGHANAMSGMISLFRVVHSMKIGKKLGIRDFKKASSQIKLSDSRFYITDKTEPWERILNEKGEQIPRRAAINNFGAGGANAHIIVEESIPTGASEDVAEISTNRRPFFLSLSTQTETQLVEYARNILDFITKDKKIDVAQLEYLFLMSRKDMNCRVVFRYQSAEDLINKLKKYIENSGTKGYYFKGNAGSSDFSETFTKHSQLKEFINGLDDKKDKGVLFELWTKGVNVPFEKLYAGEVTKKISLPAYPFDLTHFWVEGSSRPPSQGQILHPVLHQNSSNIFALRFTSKFSAKNSLLRDHIVRGNQVLPGVVYLEMVRAAIIEVTREFELPQVHVSIRDLIWIQPFVVNHAEKDIHVQLNVDKIDRAYGTISFEIYSYAESGIDSYENDRVVHAQGMVNFDDSSVDERIDISALQVEINSATIEAGQCYEGFRSIGIEHKGAYQCVDKILLGDIQDNRATEALAKIMISPSHEEDLTDYVLFPGIMDAATQASIGLLMDVNLLTGHSKALGTEAVEQLSAFLPFAVNDVKIHRAISQSMWAWVRFSHEGNKDASLYKLDIDLIDQEGRICVQFLGFSIKSLGESWEYKETRENDTISDVSLVKSVEEQHSIGTDSLDGGSDLDRFAREYLTSLFAGKLKLPHDRIKPNTLFDQYGLDSIGIITLTKSLEESFGALPKTLLFEHQTLTDLAKYFLARHHDRLTSLFKKHQFSSERGGNDEKTSQQIDVAKNLPKKKQRSEQIPGRFLPWVNSKNKQSRSTNNDIAIIGIDGIFPQSSNLDEFWENLKGGRNCITEVPSDRWDWRKYYSEDRRKKGAHYGKWGGFIDGIDTFDPLFFNISPREVETIDPQERLFLSASWKALEDAGYTRELLRSLKSEDNDFDLPAQVGVYAGVMFTEYQLFGVEKTLRGHPRGFASTSASVANRVSYVLNVHGPSMTVDTMCSSSLTSVHLACEDLKNGRCDMAIAGGVNTIVHPNKYFAISEGQFISSSGHCASFGDSADGYVPGEGVGVLILKRLQDAIDDGDNIYATIKGSAINHCGKTSAYYVPSPKAQASVIKRALKEADLNPSQVGYIEAHGTGTKLGDPIEIVGINEGYSGDRATAEMLSIKPKIGSVKSNIGHCEGASGVAGIIKVLLQMKHKKIVPSLHSNTLNSNIDFDKSTFSVNQELVDWEAPVENGVTKNRVAGISSFGAGGSNAHIVIEEYKHAVSSKSFESTPALIVISAKNNEQLKEYVQNILYFCNQCMASSEGDYSHLINFAYTLQVGREPMECRLALLVESYAELSIKLYEFLLVNEPAKDVFFGQSEEHRSAIGILTKNDDLLATISSWFEKRKYWEILDLWTKGLDVNWELLYPINKPNRISAPTYPFAKESYWIQHNGIPMRGDDLLVMESSPLSNSGRPHSLMPENISDFYGQRFKFRFSGDEYFFSDHEIHQQKILPGVAYLEMALASVESALGISKKERDKRAIFIRNVVWIQPLIASGEPIDCYIKLHLEKEDESGASVSFDVCNDGAGHVPIVYCKGLVEYRKSLALSPSSNSVPLVSLKKKFGLDQIEEDVTKHVKISQEECYKRFADVGIEYGDAHRSILNIYQLQDDRQTLTALALPGHILAELNHLSLPPSLLDGALQTMIGLMWNKSGSAKFPFAVDSVELVNPCSAHMWAWTRESSDSLIEKIDIDLYNEEGKLSIKLLGVSLQGIGERSASDTISTPLLFKQIWRDLNLADTQGTPVNNPPKGYRFVAGFSLPEKVFVGEDWKLINLLDGHETRDISDIASLYTRLTLDLIKHIQDILKELAENPAGKKCRIQLVVPANGMENIFSGCTGLLKTAQKEHPNIEVQLIEVDHNGSDYIDECLRKSLLAIDHEHIRYENGRARYLCLEEIPADETISTLPWRENGVYLITGGAGGLGAIFTGEILQKCSNTKIILVGRSEKTQEQWQIECEKLFKDDIFSQERVEYHSLDICDGPSVEKMIESIKNKYHRLDGIIHSAGIVRDQFIIKKSKSDAKKVLAPKVEGTINLYNASRGLDIDFIALFSSVSGLLGNEGQADYAAANGFMDAFAGYAQRQLEEGDSKQKTKPYVFSLNWPFWEEGGMRMNKSTLARIEDVTGVIPLTRAMGTEGFYRTLSAGTHQTLVVDGNADKIRRTLTAHDTELSSAEGLQESEKQPIVLEDFTSSKVSDSLSSEQVVKFVRSILAKVLKVSENKISNDDTFDRFGMDSVVAAELTTTLEKSFGSLPKTLLLEYKTLKDLSAYFIKNHSRAIDDTLNADRGMDLDKSSGISTHDFSKHLSSHRAVAKNVLETNENSNVSDVEENVIEYLSSVIADSFGLSPGALKPDEPLERYGLDSVKGVELIALFEKEFGTLPKTLLFEYRSTRKLADYFLKKHGNNIFEVVGEKIQERESEVMS